MIYNVEFTDTYGEDANYTWVDRCKVDACNIGHAITLAKQHRYHSPIPRHKRSGDGDNVRIDIVGACVCAFIALADVQPEPANKSDYLKPKVYTKEELEAELDKKRWCVRCGSRHCTCLECTP